MKIQNNIALKDQRSVSEIKAEQLVKLRDASKMFEKQFLQEMFKSMRGTVQKSGLIQETMGEKIFTEQLDQEYIQAWVDLGGVGFADQIYKNIVEKYFPEPPKDAALVPKQQHLDRK